MMLFLRRIALIWLCLLTWSPGLWATGPAIPACLPIFTLQDGIPVFKKITMDPSHLREDIGESEANPDRTVLYLRTPEERAPYEWRLIDGIFHKQIDGEWRPLNTGGYIEFVASVDGKIYGMTAEEQGAVSNSTQKTISHSTFLGGGPVGFAGHIRVQYGHVMDIQNFSGHYLPPVSSLLAFLDFLAKRGVDLHFTQIEFVDYEGLLQKNPALYQKAIKYAPERRLLDEQLRTRQKAFDYGPPDAKLLGGIREQVNDEYREWRYSPTLQRLIFIWKDLKSPYLKDFVKDLATSHDFVFAEN
jgi:hypothetical protein